MPLYSSYLLEKSTLTNTDNKLLNEICNKTRTSESLVKDWSYKSRVLPSQRKRKYDLTTTNWLKGNCAALDKKLVTINLENKFLKTEKSYGSCKSEIVTTSTKKHVSFIPSKQFRKKKMVAKVAMYDVLDGSSPDRERERSPLSEQSLGSDALFIGESASEVINFQEQQAPPQICFGSAPGALLRCAAYPSKGFGRTGFGATGFGASNAFSFLPPTEFSSSNGMPIYHFEKLAIAEPYRSKFHLLEKDHELQFHKKLKELTEIKMRLLNAVSVSLIYSPDFKDSKDPFRLQLLKYSELVVAVDPEFILKVALYARQELNIRSTSNFLLAYSAYHHSCRPFLKKYFASSIQLPSDWISVAELYCTFNDSHLESGSLPSALRNVMKSTFAKFDEYQLAKYNKKKRKKTVKKLPVLSTLETFELSNDKSESGAQASNERKKSFCLKRLIRLLHITSPVQSVMSLLGKKYPEDAESFRQSRLPGIWISEKAGKRMKLPQPETWETMISTQGNNPKVWETLIDNSKLPYMATLRNLKNLIISGVSEKHHHKVLNRLTNKQAVIKSRQFPLRFYAAYKIVEDIESLVTNKNTDCSRGERLEPTWKIKQRQNMLDRLENLDCAVLKRYKDAVNKALEISALHNMDPIEGKTLVICDLIKPFQQTGKTSTSTVKVSDNCIMMGLMCLKACEDCEMKVIIGNCKVENVKLSKQSFLENMSQICDIYKCTYDVSNAESLLLKALQNLLEHNLNPFSMLTRKIDNLILVLSSGINSGSVKKLMSGYLHKYRHLVNPDLLYVQVDITLGGQSFDGFQDSTHSNNIYLSGFSDQVLKYIAERGNGRQLSHVENIDKKYDLEQKTSEICSQNPLKCNTVATKHQTFPNPCLPKWKTVRIFISSTFKDMHGERDLLLRYVLPELRTRSSTIFVKICEVDLRWGVTEDYSASKRCAELCLFEAQNCDLFIGLLGERYGTVSNFEPPDDPQFDWVKNYPDSSITELEIHAGALRNLESMKSRAFFYFRNKTFLSNVPTKWLEWFASENPESEKKLCALKSRIKASGLNVFDNYYCHWGGEGNGNPVVAGLHGFGKKVLEDLWGAVREFYNKEQHLDEVSEEHQYQLAQCEKHNYFSGETSSPLQNFAKQVKTNAGTFVVTGKPGIGKSAFIVKLLKTIESHCIIQFFVGATSRSTELSYMLEYLANAISEKLPFPTMYPKIKKDIINHFEDILSEVAKASVPGNLILVIDGLDHLDINAQTLDWLPYTIPTGIKLICTASESSLAYQTFSKRERHGCQIYFVALSPLNMSDRQEVVRHCLQEHRKVLDESIFNNQMLQLVTKAQSGIPLYLHLACDYLRIFATYDNLMSTLQKLPSTQHLISEEVIFQMEREHGADIVQRALTLISVAKEGLEENELHILLSISVSMCDTYKPASYENLLTAVLTVQLEDMLAFVNFRSLLHMLRIFVCTHKRNGSLKLSSEFSLVLKKYYWNRGYEQKVKHFHQLLAAYYTTVCNPANEGRWNGLSASAFRSLPFHLFHGQCYKELSTILCSLHFIQATFQMHASEDLFEYFLLLLDHDNQKQKSAYQKEKKIDIEMLHGYYSFVSQNVHIFKCYPQMVKQQALNEPAESMVYRNVFNKAFTIECLTRSSLNNCRSLTINFFKNIISLSAHSAKPIAAIGCEDGSLKILNQNTGKVLSSLKGHSSAITSVCFIGEDRICTSSTDNTISIWSIVDYIKIAVLKGHTRHISSCCSDPSGNIIVSSAWDCTVRLWSSRDGSQVSTISDFRYPVNCVAHHPDQQLIACGLWNKCIEIWNTLSLDRKAILRGHTASVRSVVYSPDGLHIFSSSMCMEVFVWSSVQGLKIGHLNGHTLPVNSLGCCTKGNFIVTASDDCTLKVFPNQQQTSAITIKETKYCPIRAIEIVKPNSLAVAFQNGEIWVFDLIDGHIVASFDLSSEQFSCFSKYSGKEFEDYKLPIDHEIVLFGTTAGKIMALNSWDLSISTVGTVSASITLIVHSNSVILCGTSNGDIGLFSFSLDKKESPAMIYGTHEGSVTALSILMVGKDGMALSASTDMTLKLWKLTSVQELSISILNTYKINHKDYITSCCLVKMPSFSCSESSSESSPSSDVNFITGSYDNTVAVWIEKEQQIFEGLQTRVVSVQSSKKYILGCGQDGSIAVWTKSGKLISRIAGIEQSSAVIAFDLQWDKCDDNEFNAILTSVNSDGSIAVKKPFQRTPLCTLEGHSKAVTSCCVNDSGDILSSAPDMTVNIWKIPSDFPDNAVRHSGMITGVALSPSGNLALSSDVHGNIILWALNVELKGFPMRYVAQKKYIGGCISVLLWLTENKFACATSFQSEEHALKILNCCQSSSDHEPTYLIKEEDHFKCSSEITCLDYVDTKNIYVLGLKSGTICFGIHEHRSHIKVADDWILRIKVSQDENSVLCIVQANGMTKYFSLSSLMDLCTNKCTKAPDPLFTLLLEESPDLPVLNYIPPIWITALSSDKNGKFYIGDANGWLRIMHNKLLCTKKVHTDSITGICVSGSHLFTSSLDRTLKIWRILTLEQIGQFHCAVPITCLALPKEVQQLESHLLLIGSTTGVLQLLKWQPF